MLGDMDRLLLKNVVIYTKTTESVLSKNIYKPGK